MIKIIRVEHIQDGIERLEFAAGMAAVEYMQLLERIIADSAAVLSVQQEILPSSVARFFTEWKEQRKEIERLSQQLVDMEIRNLSPEAVRGVPLIIRQIDLPPKDLASIASHVAERGGVALLASAKDRAHVVLMSGTEKINAGEIIGQVCILLGGKGGGSKSMAQGGGPTVDQIGLALKVGRERILAALND
jgi:alanyl-tRNA synthetase